MATSDVLGGGLVELQRALPYLTHDFPGTGGVLKAAVEDFEVEEIPAYQPSGDGAHLFLWLEKRGVDAQTLLRRVARTLGVPEREIGCAGLKDTRAITRQYLSVPATCEPRLAALDGDGVRLLSHRRHGNKLKTGHLRGNHFRIRVRQTAGALERAQAVAARLAAQGIPNYFGAQRFGRDGETLRLGLGLLAGERRRVPGFMLRLALSAAQSALFNAALAERITAGTLHRAQLGEVLQVVASGGPFVVDDPAREQARLDAGEVVPAGPMFGPKMRQARGEAAAREQALLSRYGLSEAHFAHFGKLMRGTRRALRINYGLWLIIML